MDHSERDLFRCLQRSRRYRFPDIRYFDFDRNDIRFSAVVIFSFIFRRAHEDILGYSYLEDYRVFRSHRRWYYRYHVDNYGYSYGYPNVINLTCHI